jgi:phosphoenolpyruvate phosphomutase
MVVMYGDLLFRSYILRDLIESDASLSVVVDSAANENGGVGTQDFAFCSEPDDRAMWGQAVNLERIAADEQTRDGRQPDGRWIGMVRVKGDGREWLIDALEALRERDNFNQLSIPDLINFMLERGRNIRVWYIHGHWLDVNSLADLELAGNFTAAQDL